MSRLPAALRAIAEVTGMESIEDWNNDPSRTKQEVIDALDDAIVRVEGADTA
jgi:hypothetical protein